MSYDLMVFETAKAPADRNEFMKWFERQTQWNEEHDYQSVSVSSPALQSWFMEMKDTFPPMNGDYAPDADLFDHDEHLAIHTTDYSIGREMIYAAFAWPVAEEAYAQVRSLAQKHHVGFYDVSSPEGEILFPNENGLGPCR